MNIVETQQQVAAWVAHNFPGNTNAERALGLAEEAGEVCRAVLKLEQGIRGTRDEWLVEIAKEIGDVFVKLCDVATAYGIDLEDAVAARWATVRARDWQADRVGHGIGEPHDDGCDCPGCESARALDDDADAYTERCRP